MKSFCRFARCSPHSIPPPFSLSLPLLSPSSSCVLSVRAARCCCASVREIQHSSNSNIKPFCPLHNSAISRPTLEPEKEQEREREREGKKCDGDPMKFLCAAFLAELRGELKPLSGQCLFILMFRVLRRCPKTQSVQMSKPGRA